ncbi:MAG TPA: hypothetical protein VMA95_18650 [Streptosporangiaceae bacterium]|nr:hypothetical protein [Streptosporangiaceae bacterium]
MTDRAGAGEIFTERLHLVPVGYGHVGDLLTIHRDPWIAQWYGGEWSDIQAANYAATRAEAWARTVSTTTRPSPST